METPTPIEQSNVVKFYLGNYESTSVKVAAFLAYYQRTTRSQLYRHATTYQIDGSVLDSHARIEALVARLRNNPMSTQQDYENNAFEGKFSEEEVQHAIRLVVKLGFMVDCADTSFKSSQNGPLTAIKWNWNVPFARFISDTLPKQNSEDFDPASENISICAWKLEKRCGVKFLRTDDISEHLLLQGDGKRKTLKIFHQMAYLRMQLQKYDDPIDRDYTMEECLRKGTLPPQLLFETLETFYEILFPLIGDKRGRTSRLLRQLVRKKGFDPEVFTVGHSRWLPMHKDFQYLYWGDRLKDLAALVQKPPPSTRWMSWLERHTKERNALMIAIVGLFLAALFGFIGCILTAAQLWIAYEAWKQPVSPA